MWKTNDYCFMHFGTSAVGAAPPGLLAGQTTRSRVQGLQHFPSLTSPQEGRGTSASYVFARIKWDRGCQKPFFINYKALSNTRDHYHNQSPLPIPGRTAGYRRKPSQRALGARNLQSPLSKIALAPESPAPVSPGGSRAAGLLLHRFTPAGPRRFPAELGCSLNFQCWFDFLQWYHMLLCKQSTWSGQTKEQVCCKPSPYRPSAELGQERARPARSNFSLQLKHPVRLSGSGGGGGAAGEKGLRLCLFHHGPRNSIRTRTAQPAFPQAAKISFHLRQASWGLAVKRSLSRDAGSGRGPGTVYSCQNVSDRRLRHICTSLSQAAGHTGSASNLSV